MPLAATGVTDFLALHPEWDGRGVLIGILDSGIDAGVPGLQRTPNGSPKLLDLRDFSDEGARAAHARWTRRATRCASAASRWAG